MPERDKSSGGGGRPRLDGTRSAEPRDEIIRVATVLFAENGYANTTMTSIAKAAGLRQPSVYHWFRNKEELLTATATINRFSAAVAELLQESDAGSQLKLYRLLFEDTLHICRLGPLDYHQVESVAYQRPDEFGEFWADYRVLFDSIVDLIEEGVDSGELRCADCTFAAATALSLNEGMQKLHRYHCGPGGALGLPVPVALLDDAEAVAHQSATTTLASLLVDHDALARVRAGAMDIDLDIARGR